MDTTKKHDFSDEGLNLCVLRVRASVVEIRIRG